VEHPSRVNVEPHRHANEQIFWMLEGKMEFRLGTEQRVCRPGNVLIIPGGSERWFREDTEVIDFFALRATRRQTRLHERRLNRSLRLLTDRAYAQFAPQGAPRCERGSSLKSKPQAGSAVTASGLFEPAITA
jgi:hypothetical protein